MKFHELKKILKNVDKYPGTVEVAPAPMINEGYPSNFNLSFAWYEWTQIEGQKGPNKQYITFAGEMFYTKCQPCIRPQDWKTIIDGGENIYRYLSYFHMADVSGLIARMDAKHRYEIGKFAIASLLKFFKEQNIDLSRIHVAYCQGGDVPELTDGKYLFDKTIPQDPFYSDWIELGVPEQNMIADKTRDSLLALRNYSRPSPWGYRNEIFCMHNGKLLDVATIEHLCFEPIFDDQMNIIDVIDYRHSFSISAVGMERLLMILNDYADIRQVDILKPLFELVEKNVKNITDADANILIQTLRAIHAIISDDGQWKKLNSRRKEIVRAMYLELADILYKHEVKVKDKTVTDILELNAELLKNAKLTKAVESVITELNERYLAMTENKHLSDEQRNKFKFIIS